MAYYASDANALWNRVQDKAANIARASGLTRWDDTKRRFNQETSDLNNYMSSGNWTTDNTANFRSSATKAVEDLTNEMNRYGSSTNEYKQLKNYKTYYENALGQFDRMDVVSNTQNYIGNWGDNGFDNWHTEDEYNTQRQYLDDQRNQLQSQIDETEKKMKEKGEYYNADLETLKSYRDMYDQLSEGLDYRHEWDKQYPTVEAFTASQKSQDYNYSSQLETTLAEKQADLQQKYEELSRLEAEFGAPSQNLGNALGNMFAGMTGAASTSASAARRNPEGYQHMLDLKEEVAKLREEYDAAAKDLELVQYYQNQTILNNIGRYDPKVDWKAEVDQMKEDRRKAEEMGDEESYAKIDRQIKFLAGEKEDGTDANGLYDDETYLGQWHLQNIDVEKDRAEYEDIERQLQELGAANSRGGNWLNVIGAGLADAFTGQYGGAREGSAVQNAMELATDENVLDLQRRKKELNQNLESAEKYQGRAAKSDWYNNLDEGQQAKLVELGQAAVSEDGESYQNAQGGKTSLKNFAYLDEKTDEDLRDLVYAAIGAELTGADIGFTVEDVLADYEKRLNQAQGYAQAKKDDEIQSALGHWFKTVPHMSLQAGFNQFFTGLPGYFTDELQTPNAMAFRDQYNRAFLAKYGDERLFADSAVGGSNINQLIYDVGKTTGNMLPTIVASSLLSAAGVPEAAAGAIGATVMGLSSAGNTYQQALAEGWDKDDARLFSTITGAAEGGLQYLLGGISKLGGKGAEPLLNMAERINDAGLRIATRTAIKGLSETTEELLQNRLERDLRAWLNDEDPVSFFDMTSDDWYTVLVTMISTGLLEGPGEVINTAKAGKLGNQLAGNTIPSKGILKSTQERNAILREIGETMKGDEALAYTLVRVGTELTEPGTVANDIATRMQSGKIEKNATNYGRLYNAIIEAYVESDGKIGATVAMRAVMGGAVVYNGLSETKSLQEQENARTAEIRKNNPGAKVLGENATALKELGLNDTATAIECGAIVNKVMSGSELSEAEMNRVTGSDLAGRAMRVLLGRYLGTLTDSTPADVTKAILNAAREEMKVEQQRLEDLKSMSVVEAALKAADKVRVARSAANASIQQATWQDEDQAWNEGSVLDKAVAKKPGKTVDWRYDGRTAQQPAVANSVARDMQQNAQKIADLEQQQKLLENMSFEQAAKYHFQGLDGAMAEMEQMKALQTRLAELNAEAAKLAQNRFPSKDQRTSLADINAERNKIVSQQMALMNKYSKMLRDAAEKKAAEAKAAEKAAPAKPAQNSAGKEVAVLPGGAQLTRAEYLEQMKGKMTEERANALFDSYLAATKKGNVENGQQQNANPDERRTDVGNETDSGQDRAGRPGEDAETLRQRLERSVGLVDRNGNEAARVELSAVQTDGRSTELLQKDYEGIAEFANLLYDIGFDRVTFLTHGQMMDAAGKYVPALYYNGELFLSLDYGDPGYDYKAYAKHEIAHRLVDFYRAFFNDQKAAWFVANAVQSLTKSAEEYNALFKEYAQRYRIYRSIEGITDQEFVNMVNEEILADMASGLHGKGEYVDAVDAFFKASGFNDVTSKIRVKDKNPGDVQILDGLQESEMPYNTPVTTLMSTVDVDKPNTVIVPADQVSRMAYNGLMRGLGLFVDTKGGKDVKSGNSAAYRTEEDLANKQNAVGTEENPLTAEDVKNSPIGEMIQYAQRMGFLSEDPAEAERIANAEYELFARIGTISDETNDFYMSMQFIGSAIFTAMKLNADKQYGTSYDIPAICTKTQAVIDGMSDAMKELKRGLYEDEILRIYAKQLNAGNPVTCPECYVFTHWVGIGGLLDNIYKYQNKFAEMNPEQVVKEYNQMEADVWTELNDKVKPLNDELKDPNTTEERAEQIRKELKKNTFGKTRKRLIKTAQDGLASIREKEANGQADKLTKTERDNREKWMLHADKLDALSWIKTVYFGGKDIKAENANISIDPKTGEKVLKFYVPTDILFDLNKGEEFASQYRDAWAFRTTQGAGYGKAIAPITEVMPGEGILVTKSKDAIKAKMEGKLNQLFLTERGDIALPKDAKKGTRGEALKLTTKKQLNQLFIGGQRAQSTSDARYDNASDYLLLALEMQTMHGGMQVYTKVPGAVHFFELCGMCTNMSLMPKGGGLARNEDGSLRLDSNGLPIPEDTSVGGMVPETAIELRKNNEHAGTITIGVNDRHIRAMFGQFFRDFIIPYHASGGKADLIAKFRALQEELGSRSAALPQEEFEALLAEITTRDESKTGNMPKSSDYTKTQNDKMLSDTILRNDAMYHHSDGQMRAYTEEEIRDIHDFRKARLYLLTKYAADVKAGREVPPELAKMWSTAGIRQDDPRYRSHLILQNLYRSMTDGRWKGVQLGKDIVETQIFPNEYWDTNTTYDGANDTRHSSENTENYLAYCEALGFMHRFSGQGIAQGKVTNADGTWSVRNRAVPIKGKDFDGSEAMLTDLAYQVTYDKDGKAHYVVDEQGKRVIEPYFWKVLVDRRMYGNQGQYLEQPYVTLAGLVGNGSAEAIGKGVKAVASKTKGFAHPMGERRYNYHKSQDVSQESTAEILDRNAVRESMAEAAGKARESGKITTIKKPVGKMALGEDIQIVKGSSKDVPGINKGFIITRTSNPTTGSRYSIQEDPARQNFERLKGALNNVFSTDTSERTDGDGERELAERIERSYSADSIADAEDRRAVAEAIRRAGGLTAEKIDDGWGNVLSTEVVSSEYYTKEMLEIEAANKEHGLRTKFFSGSVTIDGEDLNMAGFADTDRGVAYVKMDAVNRGDNDITKNSFIDTAPIAALSGVNSASINGRHERLHLLKDAGDANAQALFDFVNSSKNLDEINFWYQRKLRQGGYEFDDYSEEMAADLYAGALKLADKSLQKKADQLIAKIDEGTTNWNEQLEYFGLPKDENATTDTGYTINGKPVTAKQAQTRYAVADQEYNDWAPEFYSKMIKVIYEWVNDKGKPMPTKMAADQVVKWLNKSMGVKTEEIKWSGIIPYLEGKKTVERDELMMVMAENEIKIETKVLGREVVKEGFYYEPLDPRNGDEKKFRNVDELMDYIDELAEDLGYEEGDLVPDPDPFDSIVNIVNKKNGEVVTFVRDVAPEVEDQTYWSNYTMKGGSNYREILFKQPGLDYTNRAMETHWGEETGVLAHARVQDMYTEDGEQILFIEEIQSDLHNAGANNRFTFGEEEEFRKLRAKNRTTKLSEVETARLRELEETILSKENEEVRRAAESAPMPQEMFDLAAKIHDVLSYSPFEAFSDEDYIYDWLNSELSSLRPTGMGFIFSEQDAVEAENFLKKEHTDLWEQANKMRIANEDLQTAGRKRRHASNEYVNAAPDAPFAGSSDTYHEYVMKHMLRLAAEGDYDMVGWTTADTQADRWSEDYYEGYKIEYDQNLPKFMNRYGKQWGAKVSTTQLGNGRTIWSVDITPEMKESVLKTGQPLFALGEDEDTTSSNPYPPETIEHDFLAALESGDPSVLERWVNDTLNADIDAQENAKVRPPVIPTKGFVPRVTEQEKAALENKRKGLIKAKGAMRPSEKSNGNTMPKRDEANRPFRRNVQNVWSAEQIPQDAQDALERFAFTDIQATYVPDSNKQLIKNAKNEIDETGDLEKSKAQFAKIARDSFDHLVTPQDIAFGEQLLIETSRQGDMQGFLDTLASLVEMSTTAGKTLQAFRLLKQSGPIGQLYYIEKVANRLQSNLLKRGYNIDIKVDPDLSKAVVFAETDAERNEAMEALKMSIAKQLPVTFKDRIDAWRYLSMLGNARTHIRNVLGNAIFVPLRYTKDIMKAGGEYLAVKTGLIQQEDRTTALRVSQEWKDFARDQAEAWKKELQGNGKYNPAREILDMRKVLPGVLDTISRINSNGIGEGHGIWSKLLIGLEGEDWIFLRPAFTKTLAAVLQNSGYTVDQIRTSNDVEVRQAYNRAIKLAIEEAQKATYRDFSVVASALNRMKRMEGNSKISKFTGILLEGLLPFTKTPINILRRGVEYSPIGLLTSIVGTLNDVAHKNLNATQAIDNICSGLSGSAIFAIGWLMARMGWLRGKRDDEKEEEFEKLQGYQDYSLQIGKASFTIDWAAPVALPLFAGAAMKDLMDNDDEFNLIADGWNAMMMLAEPMMSLSMLDGLNSVLTTASYSKGNQKVAEIGKSMFTSYLGQFVPTIAGQAARSVDGTRRQTYVDKNSVIPPAAQRFIQSSVQNKIPFLESKKAPYVDQWGRQSTTSSKLLSAAENFFAPWYRSMVNTTYVDEQLTALHNSKELDSKDKNSILPSLPDKDFKVAGETKYLTADEYVSYATDVGQTKYTLLSSLLSDPRYLDLTDAEKAKAISYIYKYANAAGKYHIDNRYDLHNNAGAWVEKAEAAKTDYERFEIIWKKIADALED